MFMPRIRRVSLVALLVASAMSQAVWTSAQTGPDRNSPVGERDEAAGGYPELTWRFETEGSVDDAPVLAGDLLLAHSEDGYLYALDAASGEPRWQVATGNAPFAQAAFTAGEGMVYVASTKGELLAVDLTTGETRWTRAAKTTDESAGFSMPTVSDGMVFVDDIEDDHGNVYALDAATGDLVWEAEVGPMPAYPLPVVDGIVAVTDIDGTVWLLDAASGDLVASHEAVAVAPYGPVVDGGMVFIGLDGRQVLAVALDGAAARWRIELAGFTETAPVLHGTIGGALIAGMDDRIFGVDVASGDVLWEYETLTNASPWIAGGELYAPDPDVRLTALDARDGSVRWDADLIVEDLALDGGVLYASVGKSVYALDPETGEQIWRVRTGGIVVPAPLIAGDALYAGSGDHGVYAFDLNGSSEAPAGFVDSGDGVNEEPILDIRLEELPETPAFAGVWRATLPPGETGTLPEFPGPTAAAVMSGALASPNQFLVGTGPIIMMEGDTAEAGQNILLPAFRVTLENTSDEEVELLISGILPAGETELVPPGGEIELELLGGAEIDLLPGDGAFVELQRLELEAGANLLPALSVWPDLLVVDEGTIEIATGADAVSYGPNDAAVMPIGTTRFVRAEDEPATVFVLEIDGDIQIGQGAGCGSRCLSPRL